MPCEVRCAPSTAAMKRSKGEGSAIANVVPRARRLFSSAKSDCEDAAAEHQAKAMAAAANEAAAREKITSLEHGVETESGLRAKAEAAAKLAEREIVRSLG